MDNGKDNSPSYIELFIILWISFIISLFFEMYPPKTRNFLWEIVFRFIGLATFFILLRNFLKGR